MKTWPFHLTILIAYIGAFFGMYNMISPEMYREMSPPDVGYVFVPDDDTFVDTNQYLEMRFIEFGPQSERPASVTAWISRTTHDTPEPLEFERVIYQGVPSDKWFAILPALENKGDRWFYYLSVGTSEGRTFEIWKHMNWFEKFFSGFKKDQQHFWVTYEGNVAREMPLGKLLLALHIILSLGALMFLFHTLYYVLAVLNGEKSPNFTKAYKSAFWAVSTFALGAIIMGIPITWYTFGEGFMPWPTQGLTSLGDITDTKSTYLVVWWTILLLAYYRTFRLAQKNQAEPVNQKKFALWAMLALVFTIIVFMIPHSQFMQPGL